MYGTDRNIFSKDMASYFDYWFGRTSISFKKSYVACLFSTAVPGSSLVSADALIHA